MDKYSITGMSCAACAARVEKAVSKVEGVSSCSVSLLTNSMGVSGNASPESIIRAVENAGYGAGLFEEAVGAESSSAVKRANDYSAEEEALKDKKTPLLRKRLFTSLGFLILLMYISMGHMMLSLPLPFGLEENHLAAALTEMILAAIVMIINQEFFISGFKSLIHGSPNMDALVSLGSGAAFIYSTIIIFRMTSASMNGDAAKVSEYMHDLYFESAAMILTLITVGKMLEAHSKGKTTNALKSLMKLAPSTAVILKNGKEESVPVDSVKVGDIFIVRSGDSIPVDGIITEGSCAVNEAAITGESIPVDKTAGDEVTAATICNAGYIKCRAERVGRDTTLSKIIEMVSDAAATKAPIAKIADKVSGIFVPAVILIAVITFTVWMISGADSEFAVARAISVLVISCPCALGLATPVAIMVGSGIGARNGILFKTAASLEETGRIRVAALDKTGTITAGLPSVTDIYPMQGIDEEELLGLAYSLEKMSEHPLAIAVKNAAEERGIKERSVEDFKVFPGNGLAGIVDKREVYGGSVKFIDERLTLSDEVKKTADSFAEKGKTPVVFTVDGKPAGIIAIADIIKPESRAAVEELHSMDVKVIMLTGDNEKTAKAVAAEAGVEEIIANVRPEGKEKAVKELKEKYGKVLMVGDGINDAPALTGADIGFAIGAGTDVAIDAADVVLIKSRLSDVPRAIKLSRATLKNVHQNLFWAFFYNIIGIPLAAGVYYPIWGLKLSPMFGALAMSLSSFCVVTNALRLNMIKFSDDNTVTVRIKGMMCEHCEKRVSDALNLLPFATVTEISHKEGKAKLSLNIDAALDEAAIREAVQAAGYKYKGIK